MHWFVLASFFKQGDQACKDRWLDDFVPSGVHRFRKVGPRLVEGTSGWHGRKNRATGLRDWQQRALHAFDAVRLAKNGDGIITVFPQLALLVCILARLMRKRLKIVAWCFNIGEEPTGPKRVLGRWAFACADRIVVHARQEIELVHCWFAVPRGRIAFVYLQRAPIETAITEDVQSPFIVAMGSANRDYATLVEAVRPLKLRTIIIASSRCMTGIDLPDHIEHRTNLSALECHNIAAAARINIVPLQPVVNASGQVTVIEAMRLGRPVIATGVSGTIDYIEHGETGWLVPPHDAAALRTAIATLWKDEAQRRRIADAGRRFAAAQLSDDAAGARLGQILDEVAAEPF